MSRVSALLLLTVYVGAQPALACAVDCMLGRHTVAPMSHHHAHEGAPAPCHGGQLSAARTVVASPVAAPAPAVALLTDMPEPARTAAVLFTHQTFTSAYPSLDTPPPRG